MSDFMTRLAQDWHHAAMEYADKAAHARRIGGDEVVIRAFLVEAFKWERMAAQATDLEPSRSILHRSAACLAHDCGRYRDAIEMAEAGLAGSPPDEIRAELENILAKATFEARKLTGNINE